MTVTFKIEDLPLRSQFEHLFDALGGQHWRAGDGLPFVKKETLEAKFSRDFLSVFEGLGLVTWEGLKVTEEIAGHYPQYTVGTTVLGYTLTEMGMEKLGLMFWSEARQTEHFVGGKLGRWVVTQEYTVGKGQ